jgi:hypothetical protein
VIHVLATDPPVTADEVASAIDNNWTATMLVAVNAGQHISEISVTPLDGVSGTFIHLTGSGSRFAGGQAGDFSPASAMLMKFVTGLRGRDNRGRIFLPFIGEPSMINGFVDETDRVAMQSAWRDFRTNLSVDATTPCEMVVASYDRLHGGASAHATQVATIIAESPLGTQRRRQDRLRA